MYKKYDLCLQMTEVNIVHIISLVINWSETSNNIPVVLLLGVTWFFFLSLVFAPLKKVLIWERRTGSLLENQLFTEPGACEIRLWGEHTSTFV